MKPAAHIRKANMACALLYGAGFWLLSFNYPNPWESLLALALIYALIFPVSAWALNRQALQPMKARPWPLALAALILPLVYFYIGSIGFTALHYGQDLLSGKMSLAEFLSAPIESFIWVAAATLPISLFGSLVLGFIFVRAAKSQPAFRKDK